MCLASVVESYPVHYHVPRPRTFSRVQLLVRVLAFMVLGWVGLSFGMVFSFAFVALPIVAAIRLGSLGSPEQYRQDKPRLMRILHWLAAACSWAGLATEGLPVKDPSETVSMRVDETGTRATAGSALLRILTGLPSAFVLGIVCCVGVFVWMWAALSIVLTSRVGDGAFNYLVGLQRWSVRLLAYQACVVDAYPPFSFDTDGPTFTNRTATA